MTYFCGANYVQKWLHVKVMMNCYSMTTMRIWTRSGKSTSGQHSTIRTPMTTSMRGTARCALHCPRTLNVVRILSVVVVFSSSYQYMHRGSRLKMFAPFTSSTWSSMCVRSLHLDSPFLLLALLAAFFPLPQLRQEGCGLHRRLLPHHTLWLSLQMLGSHMKLIVHFPKQNKYRSPPVQVN